MDHIHTSLCFNVGFYVLYWFRNILIFAESIISTKNVNDSLVK